MMINLYDRRFIVWGNGLTSYYTQSLFRSIENTIVGVEKEENISIKNDLMSLYHDIYQTQKGFPTANQVKAVECCSCTFKTYLDKHISSKHTIDFLTEYYEELAWCAKNDSTWSHKISPLQEWKAKYKTV